MLNLLMWVDCMYDCSWAPKDYGLNKMVYKEGSSKQWFSGGGGNNKNKGGYAAVIGIIL